VACVDAEEEELGLVVLERRVADLSPEASAGKVEEHRRATEAPIVSASRSGKPRPEADDVDQLEGQDWGRLIQLLLQADFIDAPYRDATEVED
jgi:hypothetical protein